MWSFRDWHGGHWFIFLTNWALLLQTLYIVLLASLTHFAIMRLHSYSILPFRQDFVDGEPLFARLMMTLFMVQLPMSLLVTILYWFLLVPFWELCIFRRAEPCRPLPDALLCFEHGGTAVLCILSFLVGREPFYCHNGGWSILVGVAYSLWTLIHFQLKVGRGETCVPYPDDDSDCPIYDVLDWHHPEQVLKLTAIIMLLGIPALNAVCCILCKVRDCFTGFSPKHPSAVPNLM